MNKELYDKIFTRMDELGAIRKEEGETVDCSSCGYYYYGESKSAEPVLSDCIGALEKATKDWMITKDTAGQVFHELRPLWNMKLPYLIDQSDDFGEKLYSLIK